MDKLDKMFIGMFVSAVAAPVVALGGVALSATPAWAAAETIGLKLGDWAVANLLKTGGKWVGVNALGGTADYVYQVATKDAKDINYASVGANLWFGALPSAIIGTTVNLSERSFSGEVNKLNAPWTTEGLLNIVFGTVTNYSAGKVGETIGIPQLRIGNTQVPNVLGPSLEIGSNVAGNAMNEIILDEIIHEKKQ